MPQDSRLPDKLTIAGAVHDMNQMLGVITGRAGALLANDPDPELRKNLEAILLAAKDTATMARRIRGFSVEPEKSEESVPLNRVVAEAVVLAASDIDRERWPVKVNIPSRLFPGLPGQVIREVLNNLLCNAQTAMPDGGGISINVLDEAKVIRLRVQDQGRGLSQDFITRIFELGFTTSGNQEKGVGLPASRSLMRSWGGDLKWVSSPEPGALFEMEIPHAKEIQQAEQAAQEGTAGSDKFPPDNQPVILVVDDDQAMREMLFDVLTNLGCEVVATRDATEAVAEMKAGRFQIALVDQNLPGMKGLDLAQELRSRDPLITLVLVTGWGNEDLDAESTSTVLDLVARKPLEFGAIKDLIGQGLIMRDDKEQAMKERTE